MFWQELADELEASVEEGNLLGCIERVSNEIAKQPDSPFLSAISSDFTNSPEDIALKIGHFFTQNPSLKSVYCEMNGFYINPDRWYFELDGFKETISDDIYEKLAHPDVVGDREITLTGMEKAQKIYASNKKQDTGLFDLLVVYKFQNLVKNSVPLVDSGEKQVIATVHDYDFFYISTT